MQGSHNGMIIKRDTTVTLGRVTVTVVTVEKQ